MIKPSKYLMAVTAVFAVCIIAFAGVSLSSDGAGDPYVISAPDDVGVVSQSYTKTITTSWMAIPNNPSTPYVTGASWMSLTSSNLSPGSGSPTFSLSGKPTAAGTYSCTIVVPVSATSSSMAVDLNINWTCKVTSSPVSYTVSYNSNGGSGSMSSHSTTSSLVLKANTFTAPANMEFSGWKANNSGSLLSAGASYTPVANTTMYAQWVASPPSSSGGSGDPIMLSFSDDIVLAGSSYNRELTYSWMYNPSPIGTVSVTPSWLSASVPVVSGSTSKITVTGTAPSVTGSYNVVITIPKGPSASSMVVDLIIKYTLDVSLTSTAYSVSFDPNGGSGVMPSLTVPAGNTISLPNSLFAPPSGKYFAGWKVNDTGSVLSAGSPFTPAGDTKLFAQWDSDGDGGGDGDDNDDGGLLGLLTYVLIFIIFLICVFLLFASRRTKKSNGSKKFKGGHKLG